MLSVNGTSLSGLEDGQVQKIVHHPARGITVLKVTAKPQQEGVINHGEYTILFIEFKPNFNNLFMNICSCSRYLLMQVWW